MNQQFNAVKAKEIATANNAGELNKVLKDIEAAAKARQLVLHIYKRLFASTLKELRNLGFQVTEWDSVIMQSDELYYSIYWN